MSKADPESGDKADDQSPETSLRAPPLGRRLFIFKATAILSGVAAFGFGRSAHGQTDFDVTDHGPKGKKGPVRGGGVTDKDPDDPEGGGRGGRGQKGPRQTSGVSDKDPDDPEGGGRGQKGRPRRTSGITDKDPSDPEGGGRSGGQKRPRPVAGVTDKDPSDPEGGGRGAGGGQGGGAGRGPDRR
jgi:hypothetical protein